jgi:hypothetical protein
MSDSGRVIGECRHGANFASCPMCEIERFQKLTRDMGPLPTTMGPTTAEVARAEAATLRAALARLLAACERLRDVRARRDADESEYAASGMTYSFDVLRAAEAEFDAAMDEARKVLTEDAPRAR